MSRTLELPESVYDGLLQAARASGVSPADWIAAKLPGGTKAPVSDEGLRVARARLWRHVASLGAPTGTDNEGIAPDPAGLRDPEALTRLPEDQRAAWQALGADGDALLEKAQGEGSR
jgi:hypothetical protein